ncbi:MAG: hypothetical protein ACYDHM_04780 [Acidiferrobacterales bacterium]
MKRLFLAGLLLVYGGSALADPPAVKSTNYQFGYESGDLNTVGGSDSRVNAVDGSITFPVAGYLGASVSAFYEHYSLAANFASQGSGLTLASTLPQCTEVDKGLNADLFVRDPSVGRISAGYGVGQAMAHCQSTFLISGGPKLDTRNYSAGAEYYFRRFTLGASWDQTRFNALDRFTSDSLTGSWYPTRILRVDLTGYGQALKNTYSLEVEFQPEFFDNSSGLWASYTRRHQTVTNNIFMVGIRYYFGNRVDLLTRDREYR